VNIERISRESDPRVADYRDLKDAELRRRAGLFVAEGREVTLRLLRGGRFRVRSLLVTQAALDALAPVLERLDAGWRVYLTTPEIARAVVGYRFHLGCVAVAERGPDRPAAELIEPSGPRRLLVLEEVANPDNVGGVFRNAMAFGADGVLLSPGCADPLYRKSIRVSAGATLCVPFARLPIGGAGLDRLRQAGYVLAALTPRATATDLTALEGPTPDRLALLLGAEGPGLGDESFAAADLILKIGITTGLDSLNVATASGIALHWLRAVPRD